MLLLVPDVYAFSRLKDDENFRIDDGVFLGVVAFLAFLEMVKDGRMLNGLI